MGSEVLLACRADCMASPRAHHLFTFHRIIVVVVRVGGGEQLQLGGDFVQLRVTTVLLSVLALAVLVEVVVSVMLVVMVYRHALIGVFVAETFSTSFKNV